MNTRNNTETTIERVAQCHLPTEFGDFELVTYRDTIDNQIHYAMQGRLVCRRSFSARVHLHDTFTDLLHSDRGTERSWSLDKAMKRIGDEGGVLVILGNEESSDSLIHKVKTFGLKIRMSNQPWLNSTSRRVGVGSQILQDLGVSR
ncbi:hypothetical protein O9992_04955 [Vibrio lentus]|nr:hypothetical protein [Vibrio lentus]